MITCGSVKPTSPPADGLWVWQALADLWDLQRVDQENEAGGDAEVLDHSLGFAGAIEVFAGGVVEREGDTAVQWRVPETAADLEVVDQWRRRSGGDGEFLAQVEELLPHVFIAVLGGVALMDERGVEVDGDLA